MVKAAKLSASCGHAATGPPALFKHADAVAGLYERAGSGNARDASANDGNV